MLFSLLLWRIPLGVAVFRGVKGTFFPLIFCAGLCFVCRCKRWIDFKDGGLVPWFIIDN